MDLNPAAACARAVLGNAGNRRIYRHFRRTAASWVDWLLRGQKQQFYFLAVLVGLLAGGGAVAFHGSIQWAEHAIIYRAASWDSPWRYPLVIALPCGGGLLAGWLMVRFAPRARGSGIPQVKERYFLRFGRIRLQTGLWKFFLGTLSIGTGASLGREGPTVQIAAALASSAGRWLGLVPRDVARLIPMAAAGGIAAAFNTPLAGIMFAIEEIMGDLKHRALAGIVLVAVIAAVLERSLLGSRAIFVVPPHAEFAALDLVWSLVLGLVAGLVAEIWVKTLLALRQRALQVRGRWSWALPGVGGLATGLVGAAVLAITGRSGVFGIGYQDMTAALSGAFGLGVLALLCGGKFFATIFSYSSGGAGGIFAPTLFIGATLGGAVASLAAMLAPRAGDLASPLIVVGMGAMFAGIIRAPVTSILMIFELTGDYTLILPIMLANLTAYTIASRLRPVAIYDALLLQDGISLRRFPLLRPSETWQHLPVATIISHDVVVLPSNLAVDGARARVAGVTFRVFPLVDAAGRYAGMVHRKGIERVARDHPGKTVGAIKVEPPPPVVFPDQPIREVIDTFVQGELNTLAVVSRADPGRIVGIVTLHDITRQQFLREERAV